MLPHTVVPNVHRESGIMKNLHSSLWCLLLSLLLLSPSQGATQQVFIPEKFKGKILNAPEPHYPHGIERITIRAQGVYRLTINPQTGGVDEVGILRRCGDSRLDASCVMAFFQWKFKPGTLKQLDVPVVFERFVSVVLKNAGYR